MRLWVHIQYNRYRKNGNISSCIIKLHIEQWKAGKVCIFPVRCNKKNLSNIHVHQLNTIIYDQFQFKFLSIVNSSEYHTSCYFISFLNHKSRKRNKERFGHSITYKKILMNTQSPLMFII